uniref:E3 ubiquitin-protein ligase RMA n=1 Tax=Saccharum hybrid cultivar R570 TaxID=131158 RepID=A0A059PZX4_9POAL|nr:zinc finger, C3HC4 type family protein [Saccharum hybrid cultivar R570]
MAGEEAAEGSGRRHMDLNLHVGLPPLPRPRVRLDTSAASPALMPNSAAPEAPRTSEPEESLVPAAATYSLSNALSALEEHPMLDPIVYSWLDGNSAGGEEYTDAPEPSAPAPVDGLLVARSVRPSRVAAATGMEMVNTSTLGQSTQGAAATAIEAGAPELRFLRVIQISQQHNIVRPGSANLSQSSFEAARGQNLDGGDNSSFDCNICLELARQPVVTSCGHLFCWPCLRDLEKNQWLHAQSSSFERPVCKGEVLKGDITPIYRRGGEEEGGSTANPDLPPRPQAHRREDLRRQLQMAGTEGNAREMARVLRQMFQNQNQGWDATPAGVETTSVPAARQRAGARRQQRQDSNAAQVVLVAPQPSSSVEQLSTSSTAAAVVGEPGPSSRSRRPSESPTIRACLA